MQPNPYTHKLKCYYTTSGGNPLLLLAPVKVEEFYLNPYIVLYHDVISDREIEIVKEISVPKVGWVGHVPIAHLLQNQEELGVLGAFTAC